MKKLTILLIAMVYLTMMSCKHNDHQSDEHDHEMEANVESDHDHEGETKEHEHEGESEEEHEHQYKTGKVRFEPFNQIIKTSGEIKTASTSELELVASNSGILHFADTKIVQGAMLNQGQAVFYITSDNLAENNFSVKYNQVKAEYEKTKSDYERAEQLVKKQIISDKEFQQVKVNYLSAKSQFESLNNSSSGKGIVNTPSKAYIKEIFASEGQYVETGQRLAVIDKQDKLLLVAEVSQKYISQLSKIESANFVYSNNNKVFDTQQLNGKLLAYAKAVDSRTYYLPVTFEIDYQKELVPGSYVQVFLKGQKTEPQIIIPKSALVEEQGNYFVYVEEGHDKFHKHQITLGDQDGINVLVLNGLEPDETIVTEGAYFVKLANMSGGLPAHNHSH